MISNRWYVQCFFLILILAASSFGSQISHKLAITETVFDLPPIPTRQKVAKQDKKSYLDDLQSKARICFDDALHVLPKALTTRFRTKFGANFRTMKAAKSSDGNLFITVLRGQTPQIWDGQLHKHLFSLEHHGRKITYACFSPDGEYVITTSKDGTAHIWELRTESLLFVVNHSSSVLFASFTDDGSGLITATSDKKAIHWLMPSDELIHPASKMGTEGLIISVYLQMMKRWLKENKKSKTYDGWIKYLVKRASYLGLLNHSRESAETYERSFFQLLNPHSKEYINLLLPGRPRHNH